MSLSHDIISEFVKVTNNNKEKPKEGIVYATIVQASDGKYVKIDGSDLLTPTDTTTDIEDGERVTVMIKDHKATVTGNVSSPSASGNRVDKVVDVVSEQIGVFETVVADKVSTNELEAYKATIEYLVAGKAEIEDLEAINAKIENLEVKDAEIENAIIDKATIEDLEAINAKIENLEVKDAEIENAVVENLEATKADIQILNADFAQIKTLVSGNLTSDNILSFNITADKVTMEDAFIKDAMIDTVNAAKINAGRINTNSVVIGSEDGGMCISGATQQFTDKNGNVRIQIGRDASDDFTFALYGEDGRGQLINQNGITASAISDGIIINDMISDDASISGGKLDISSVVTEINNDNTTTIKSNKIYLDEQNQSLEVAFNSLKTQVDTIKDVTIDGDLTAVVEQVQSNTTQIEVNKSSIQTLISEDTVIKKQVTDLEGNLNETTTTLESKYTTLNQNLDGFKTTVADTYATKTSINDVKNDLSANYSTTSNMNSAINQKVDEITASVSSTYATKNEVKTIDDNIRSNYSTTEQMESAISIAKNEINLGISQIYETKNEVQNKIDNVQVGGTNLWVLSDLESGFENNGDIRYDTASHKIRKTLIPTNGSRTLVYQCWNENLIINTANANRVAFYGNDREYISNQQVLPLSGNKYQLQLIDIPENTRYVRLAAICGSENGVYDSSIKIKFEFGNKATSYNFAPEDIESDFVNIGNEVQNIETDIKTNYSTTEQMNSAINIAKDSINLNVSQTYETKDSVNSKMESTLSSAKTYADSQISLAKDAINLGVSNFKSEMMSASFTNLLYNSDFVKMENDFPKGYTRTNSTYVYNGGWLCPEGGKTIHIYTIGTGATWQGFYSPNVRVNKDQTMTASVYVATENKDALQGVVGVEIEWVDANSQRISVSGYSCKLDQNHLWYRISATGYAPEGTVYARVYCWNSFEGATWWGKPMLQIGSVCTAWNKGGDFENLDERLSSAEIKITDDSITNIVKQNFYTKSETEGQITSKGYVTSSEVQQTVDQLQIKFTQKGGYNLIRNGGFEKGDAHWNHNNSPTIIGDQSWQNYDGKSMLLQGHSFGSGLYQVFPTTPYKVYSYSFYAQAEHDTWFVGIEGLVYSTVEVSPNDWRYYSGTFTATGTSHVFVIYPNGGNRNIYIDNVMVCEGSVPSVYTPHPNEMYDGIIQMDKDGIKVSTSNGGWTDFTSAGMNVYNKSSMLSLGTRNGGLTYHNSSGYLGFTSESVVNAYGVSGVTLSTANAGSYIVLGTSTTTDPFGGFSSTPALSIAKADLGDSTSFYHQGVNLHTTLNVNTKPIKQIGTMYYANGLTRTYESTTGNLCLFGDNGVVLGYYNGTEPVTKFKIIEGSSAAESYIDTYSHWRCNGWDLSGVWNLKVRNTLQLEKTGTIYFNNESSSPSLMWEASNRLKIYGDNGIDFGYRNGTTNTPIFSLNEGVTAGYRIESFSHWHFHNWNLDYVGNVHAQKYTVATSYGSYYITTGTGDGNDYNTYGCKFHTHNGLAFTDNGGTATLIVQGRQGRIMGKNAYYVNCSRSLKSDIRSVVPESDVATFEVREGESLDTNISVETVCDFLDTINVKTYVTDFKQEGATQECFDVEKGNSLTLGYIADDIAEHPVFKYIGEKTNDGLYAVNSNSLTTALIVGYQHEKRKREQLEERLMRLEQLLKGDE